MKQVFQGFTTNAGTTADSYLSPLSPKTWNTSSLTGETIAGIAATIRNLVVSIATAPGAGNSLIYTILVDGVSSGITCTISDTATSASDLVHSSSFSAGAKISLRRTVTGTPTLGNGTSISLESEGNAAAQSWYSNACDTVVSNAADRFNSPWNGSPVWTSSSTEVPIAAAGSIRALYVSLAVGGPGVGKSYTIVFMKNGVAQDGTGGTPDTRVTIADTATDGNASFSLAVTDTDTIILKSTPSGTPTSRTIRVGVGFTATTDGESQFSAVTTSPSAASTSYNAAQGYSAALPLNWGTPETAREMVSGPTSFVLRNLHVLLETAPGSGNTLTISLRRNQADPSGGPTVTIADTNTTGNDASGSATLVSGDTFAMKAVPVSTPSVGSTTWTMVQYIAPLLAGPLPFMTTVGARRV